MQYKNLSTKEALSLQKKFGQNEITSVRRYSLLKSLWGQFNNFLIILLIFAGGVAWALGEKIDGGFIFAIVILNAAFGVFQEFKAEKSLDALKKITITLVRIIRDGKEQTIDSKELVPGDLIYLEEGSRIPADAVLVKSWGMEVNEAALTGESMPVSKSEEKNDISSLFMGTVVARGRGYAHVLHIGNSTRLGQINKTLSSITEEPTPLQKKLALFTKQIGWIGVVVAIVVFALSFLKDGDLFNSFLFSVSLAVAAIPEGLPAVMAITLAIGVERMSRKKAIVRRMNAIETLGSVTLVATDKTGTLTRNEMVVKKVWVGGKTYEVTSVSKIRHKDFPDILNASVLCSTSSLALKEGSGRWDVIGDTTEGALLMLAQDIGINYEDRRSEWETMEMIPFDATLKRMEVKVKKAKERHHYIKGAPESILSICRVAEDERTVIKKEFEAFAKKGLRMLAFADGDRFLGFVGIADPVRPEIKESVSMARQAGIRVVMLTGDSPLTAQAIALETGIIKKGEDIVTGQQLDSATDEEMLRILPKVHVFARISPEHKLRLATLYQKSGEIIAVTGDGVNDALALKKADVGVAMGLTGTDVAKETAEVVLTDDNFATLIQAVDEGRSILRRIQLAILYLLACNGGEILYVLTAIFTGIPLLTATQLLYINLVTDGLPALIFAFRPNEKNVMKKPPVRTLSILKKGDFCYIAIISILTAGLTALALLPVLKDNRLTLVFTIVIFFQQFILINLWGRRFTKGFWVAFLFPFVLHPIILYISQAREILKVDAISPYSWIWILFACASALLVLSVYRKKTSRTKA